VDALRKAGVDVDIASLSSGIITGKRGAQVQANLAVTDVDPDDYDLLLLPGGKAPQTLRESEPVLDLARTFTELGKPIAAICHGPQILISAGLVKGRKMTSYLSVGEELKAAEARYLDEPLVRDRNFITSRNPNDLPRFIDGILETLGRSRRAA
jgi:protease I